MQRRALIAGIGGSLAGATAGCLGTVLGGDTSVPRLVGLEAGNWHPAPQILHVRIESDADILYEEHVDFPGGDPSNYDRPHASLDDHPSDLPPSATLATWVEPASRDQARTLAFGDRDTECIGIEIDICPSCGNQLGQADISAPDVPDTLIKRTANCDYG